MRLAWISLAALPACGEPPLANHGTSETGSTMAGTATTDAATTDLESTATSTGDPACAGPLSACPGSALWLRDYRVKGSAGAVAASALAIAANGDIVAAGNYYGTFEFAGESYPSISQVDLWLARFAADGAPLWFRHFDGELKYGTQGRVADSLGNLAFATNGDIVLTTTAFGDVDLGDGPLVGDDGDPVLVRLSAAGQVQWARRVVGTGRSEYEYFPRLVAPAADDRVWLVATLYNTSIDLGGGPLNSAGWGDLLLAQLDEHGEHVWSRRLGDAGHQVPRAVAAVADGGLLITGALEGTLQLGDVTLASAGMSDVFVLRLDADGAAVWGRRYGDKYDQGGSAVTIDAAGITLAGSFASTIDLGGGPLTALERQNPPHPRDGWYRSVFMARLDLDGTHRWSAALHADESEAELTALARTEDGTLAFAGTSSRRLSFGGQIAGHSKGKWFGSLAADGAPRWLQSVADSPWPGQGADSPLLAVDREGALVTVFGLFDTLELGAETVGTAERATLVLGKYVP